MHPNGNDKNLGSVKSPFKTIQYAIDFVVENKKPTVVLRGGDHFLEETIQIHPKHSGLSLLAYPGETPIISGGIPLKVTFNGNL